LAHYMMGLIDDLSAQADQAVREYELSLKFNAQVYAPHLRLGADYARIGRLDEAVDVLHKAIALDPDDPQSRYLLALIYSTQKKFDEAASQYEWLLQSASKDNPDNIEIYMYLAQLYYAEHQYAKAIVQFQKILELKPKDTQSLYLLGSLYLETGKRQDAYAIFKKVLDQDPDHDGALNSLGYMYAEDGIHLDEALSYVQRAIAIDGSNGAYYDSLGWVWYKKGQYKKALEALQQAAGLIEDAVVFDHMGDVYKALKQVLDSRRAWRRSLELVPNQRAVLEKLQSLDKAEALKGSN